MTSLLIVGAGPTGLTAAVELARRGILARMIDKKTDPLPLSRAVGINAHSLALLEPSGVAERLLAAGIHVRELVVHDDERPIAEQVSELKKAKPHLFKATKADPDFNGDTDTGDSL